MHRRSRPELINSSVVMSHIFQLDMEEGSIPKPPTYYGNASNNASKNTSNKTASAPKKNQDSGSKSKEKPPAKKKFDYDAAIANFQNN
jgi:hypothetical protein